MDESEEARIKEVMMMAMISNGVPIHPKPGPNYVCHRCGEHGHFIKYCPTNGNPNFDATSKRTKRPSGIPTAFIRVVHNNKDEAQNERGEMWETSSGQYAARIEDLDDCKKALNKVLRKSSPELSCNICKNPPSSAVMTRCCCLTFCLSCISQALTPPEYRCPKCPATGQMISNLIPNCKIRDLVRALQSGKICDAK